MTAEREKLLESDVTHFQVPSFSASNTENFLSFLPRERGDGGGCLHRPVWPLTVLPQQCKSQAKSCHPQHLQEREGGKERCSGWRQQVAKASKCLSLPRKERRQGYSEHGAGPAAANSTPNNCFSFSLTPPPSPAYPASPVMKSCQTQGPRPGAPSSTAHLQEGAARRPLITPQRGD